MTKTRLLLALCAAALFALPVSADARPGQIDPTFAGGAVGGADIGPFTDSPQAVIRLANGNLLVAGSSAADAGNTEIDIGLLELDPSGNPVTGFGTSGHAIVSMGAGKQAANISVGERPDGSLLIGATTTGPSAVVATVSASGTPSAPVITALPAGQTSPTDTEVDGTNGFVYVVGKGSANNHVALTRFDPAGALDGGFGTAGVADRTFGVGTSAGGPVPRLLIQPDGLPLVGVTGVEANNTTPTTSVLRFTTGGQPDGSWGTGGEARMPAISGMAQGPVVRIARSAAGVTALVPGTYPLTFVRFTPAGQPDASFDGDGLLRGVNSDIGTAGDFTMADDGSLVVDGQDIVLTKTATAGTRVAAFVTRFAPDGSSDAGWGGPGFFAPVSVFPASDTQTFGPTASVLTPQGVVIVGSFNPALSTDTNPTPLNRFGFVRLKTAPNAAPVVSLLAAPSAQSVGTPVAFTATASDPDAGGSVVKYEWDFDGDGTIDRVTTSGATSFTYLTPGSYTSSVRVTDDEGGTAQSTSPVTIAALPPSADAVARAAAPAGLKAVGLGKVTVSKKAKKGKRTVKIPFTKLAGAAGPLQTFVIIKRGSSTLVAQAKNLSAATKSLTYKVAAKKKQKLKISITLVDRFGNVRKLSKTVTVP